MICTFSKNEDGIIVIEKHCNSYMQAKISFSEQEGKVTVSCLFGRH